MESLDVAISALCAPVEIWINDSPGANHWLEFRLEGVSSNRDAIGALIKLTARGKSQYNEVVFASGYASSGAGPIHFGLGSATSASLVETRWPSSGSRNPILDPASPIGPHQT
jgi:enediyne biosynthesis protein E4